MASPPEVKLELFRHYDELARMLAAELFDEEVNQLAGPRYAREGPGESRYHRWGSNPGSVRIGPEKVPVSVPRVRDPLSGQERPLESYQHLHAGAADEDALARAVLLGLSQRDYKGVAERFVDGFGLSQSSVSRAFVNRSREALERFLTRSLADEDFVALWIDGKSLACEQIVLCVGLRSDGVKRILGFVECSTENAAAISGLLRQLIERGLGFSDGLLCVVDGAKGLAKAVRQIFGRYALVQRCQWHKRENVLSYLNKQHVMLYRGRLQAAYQQSSYTEAKAALLAIHAELQSVNLSAARSLAEGLEETLTLHRLGLFVELGISLKTTNCIESVNSRIAAYLGKVKHWVSSDQRQRWVALAVLEIEPRFNRIKHADRLPLLQHALQREIQTQTKPPSHSISN